MMKKYAMFLMALIVVSPLMSYAKSPAHRACQPLPQLGTPIRNLPSDPHQYCEPPWTNPSTVAYTCEAKLTQLNAYSTCHYECGPGHTNGDGDEGCIDYCLARICRLGY